MGIINTKYSVVRAREPTSFGRENVTAIVILSRCGWNKESNVRSFIISLSVEGWTSFSINNRTNFIDEKTVKWGFPGCLFLRTRAKTFKLNLVLVFKSKALYYNSRWSCSESFFWPLFMVSSLILSSMNFLTSSCKRSEWSFVGSEKYERNLS